MTQPEVVLYVDDEEPNRIVFEATFGDSFAVAVAASAEEALERLEQGDVAVLITDQRMPGTPGNMLLAEVKKRRSEVIRMVITAYDDVEEILSAVNQGLVARYFVKPWSRKELEEALRWGVDAYRAGRDDLTLQLRLLETERLTALGTIAAEILHDLKQPLSYLAANLDWLAEMADVLPGLKVRAGPAPSDDLESQEVAFVRELPDVVDDIGHGIQAITALAQTYRTIVMRARPKELEHGLPLEQSVAYAVRIARRAGHDLGVEVTASPTTVLGGWLATANVASLSRALLNLLENAVHAAAAGSQSADATGAGGTVHVDIRVHEATSEARLAIRDNGAGMDDDALRRLGVGFYTTKAGGTGLGFAQARRQVGMAGGRLEVKSTPGAGTVIEVSLPVQRA